MNEGSLRLYREELGRFASRWPGTRELPVGPTVAHGKDLTLDHVGPKVPLRVYTGPKAITLTPAGGWLERYNYGSKVIAGMHFDGCTFTIPSAYPNIGITFAHCKFTGVPVGGFHHIQSASGFIGGGVSVINCEFDAAGWAPQVGGRTAMNFPTLEVQWSLFQGFDRLLRLSADSTVEGVYARHIGELYPGDHVSLISAQLNPLSNTVLRKSKLLARRAANPADSTGISGALTHYNDNATHLGPFTIEDNYFAGGGQYAAYLGGQNDTLPHSKNLTFRRNVFGRDFARFCADSAPTALVTQQPSTVWENNTWGAPGPFFVEGDPAEGAAIAPAYASSGTPNLS